MLRPTCRVYQLMLLVAVVALPSAWAEDRPLQIEYASSQYDASLEEAELEEAELAQCECGDCSGCAHHCFWTRPTLTGDWLGHRSCLQQRGFTFRGNVTQFGFGISGGIDTPVPPPFGQGDRFKYTGRGEYDFIFDLDKFGGLPGGKLLVGVQHWWGEFGNVSLNTGNFIPAIFPAALPPEINDPGVPFITDFIVTQPLAGGKLVVFAGKKNVIGAADQDIFAGGDGTDQFMNQALIANPAFLLALPYSSFTAGVALPQKWGMVSAFVYDPQDRTRDFFRLNDLFSEGIIVGGEVKVNTNLLCRPGEHHVGGIWKHTDLPDLSGGYIPPPEYPYPPAPPGVASKPDSYTIYYGFDQYLQVYSDQPRRGWGFFGRASISDANPTPYRYFLSAGIGGDSPVACHRGDTFGVGWFYKGTSTKYGPVAQAVLGPQDGTGVELYYNFQVTPWLNVTPDIQYIRPDFGALGKDSFIYGLRVNMKL